MTYYRNEPKSQDRLCVSQKKLRENSVEFPTVFAANHRNFNQANSGTHKLLALINQTEDPEAVGTTLLLYCKAPDLFIKRVASDPVNWTKIVKPGGVFLPFNASYNSFKLPSGLIVYMGHTTIIDRATRSITVSLAGEYPYTQKPYVYISQDARVNTDLYATQIYTYDIERDSFKVYTTWPDPRTPVTVRFTWIAIGV